MKVSVIIPTYNGAHKILNVLKCLEVQSYKDFEVIVIIDGSTDGTEELLRSGNLKINNLKIIEQSNQGRSVVRNNGATAAEGDLLIFFDDDMIVSTDCIYSHLKFHENNKNSVLVGRVRHNIENPNCTDFDKYRYYLEKKWFANFKTGISRITLSNYVFTTQNLSIPKQIFTDINGFDNQLTDSEDFDLSMRLFKNDIKIFYNYDSLAYHNDIISIEKYIKRQKEYLLSKQKLLRIHPLYKNMHPDSFTENTSVFKKNLLLPLRYNKIIKHIITSKYFLNYLPLSFRYKFYTYVIFASNS